MSLIQVLVIAIGLYAGYWLVSRLFPGDLDADAPLPPQPPAAAGGDAAWHDVLGVPATASEAQIREAYKALLSQYHPDKVASLGRELQEVAERKSKEITQAYREATQSLNLGG